jgi:phage portal protein BeeE
LGAIGDYARGARTPGTSRGNLPWAQRRRPAAARTSAVSGLGQQPPAGTPGRSVISTGQTAFVRLLQAMRSNAPGGWSDDRWEQTMRHFSGFVYVAIHRIAMQMTRSEFQVYHRDDSHPDGKKPVRKGDPPVSARFAEKQVRPYDLVEILQKPNPQDTWGRSAYRWIQQKFLTGTALTWMVPNAFGTPYELYPVPTALAIPQPAVNPEYPNGFYRIQPVYPYGPFSSFPAPASSVGAPIGGQWMMKGFYPHPLLRYEGYSPQTALRLHIDSIEMIDRARHYMMRRGIYPSAVLNGTEAEGAEVLDDAQIDQIRAMFESEHQGPENMGRLFVAYAGWKLEQFGTLPTEMAFEGGWEQLSAFILGGGFGISASAAGMVETSSYASLFACLKQLHLTTLEPECEDMAAVLTRTLAPFFGDDLIVEVRCPRIDDQELKFSKLSTAMSAKCVTKNEVRHELGWPLTREDWGGEIAGEQSQPAMGMGMPGVQAGGVAGPAPQGQEVDPNDPLAALLASEDPQGDPLTADTGGLGDGSLGPRQGTTFGPGKSLRAGGKKRFSVTTNGRH